jgi:hypothetical protein
MGKILILIGILLIGIGILLVFKIPIPFLGKLPGDIYFKGENYQVFFPIATCIVLSLIFSLLYYLFSR